jgi:chitinase
MTFIALLLLTLLSLVSSHKPVVFAYLPEWRYAGADFETICKSLTHIALFSAEPGPDGSIWGLDRLPNGAALIDAQHAAAQHGCKLIICFGGNGRSTHFSAVVRSSSLRRTFVANVVALIEKMGAAGVDYNWEYPGFAFGTGYASDKEAKADYRGLLLLVKQTRKALGDNAALTLAYYPDGKQEAALVEGHFSDYVDLFHAMTYDAPGVQHSPMELAQRAIDGATAAGLPLSRLTLGVPFYGRSATTGDWTTYEDLVQRHAPLSPSVDSVKDEKGDTVGFNGREMIAKKTRLALEFGLAGLMIWEIGQDCRQQPVVRDGRTHGVTCPEGRQSSLLAALTDAVAQTEPTPPDL